MTDTRSDQTSDSGGATKPDNTPKKPAAAKTGAASKRSARPTFVIAILVLLLIIAALAGAVWYQYQQMQQRDDAVMRQTQQSSQAARAASEQATQALALAREQAVQIEQMQTELADADQHLQSLEQALQTLTDSGTEIALINDVDHLVSIAHQQLLLGGNVSNAIIAMETAQARLARANRPGLASLQQAINGDVERLRAVSTIDVNRLSSRIDELGRLVDSAPLLIPDDAAPAVAPQAEPAARPAPAPTTRVPDPDASWWQEGVDSVADWSSQAWNSVTQELGSFISVRRVDDAAALLMSPEQASSLRDKIRLRLMTAQLALLMNQPDVWQTETRAVVQMLQSRYDVNSVEGHRALRLALQLADTSIHVELPSVGNSQSAIQTLREEHARKPQNGADEAAPNTVTSTDGSPMAPEATQTPDESQTEASPGAESDASQQREEQETAPADPADSQEAVDDSAQQTAGKTVHAGATYHPDHTFGPRYTT